MAYNYDPMDQPPEEWRRVAELSELDANIEKSPENPGFVATLWVSCLGRRGDRDAAEFLRNFSTPESLAAWGDFGDAARFFDSIPEWGLATRGQRAVGDDAVHYVAVLSGVADNYEVTDGQVVNAAAIITLAWSTRRGSWLVHSLGGYAPPDQVPHYT